METKPAVTVEIFRDADRKKLSIDTAEMGIDIIRQSVADIEIVRQNRLLTIARPEQTSVNAQKVRWPRFEADLNIVMTDRSLASHDKISDETRHTIGHAIINQTSRIAIVDAVALFPEYTVAHEVGHLLGLKHDGYGHDGSGHCVLESCLMHSTHILEPKVSRREKRGVALWMERRGYREAEYEVYDQARTTTFCDECQRQLARRAFFLLAAKTDRSIPREWYS